ncbi:MAG TPA: cytochrome c family protein [Chromatiales bacterium]|nr:cytochrome c family protein [Thiotrichales bacterium]HIP68491.1 cytochrome c family protein [Chromatiales bacterium]
MRQLSHVLYKSLLPTILLLSLPLSSQANPDPGKTSIKAGAPHEVSAEVCGSCHKEIYAEWKGSMHAQSSALVDPIHGAFYRKVVGDPKQEGVTKKGKFPVCLRCHAPNAAIRKKTKLDSKIAFNEGVNCVFCHTLTKFKGTTKPNGKLRLGQAAYENSTTALQAPSGKNYSTAEKPEGASVTTPGFHPFPMEGGNSALLKSNDVCMGCHDRRNNFHGVPLCATGTEIADSKVFTSCQSCHMATVNGHADHSMAGGHTEDMVRRAVIMDLNVSKKDGQYQATVKILNKLPHKFPTGAPFRNVYLKLTAYDDGGNVVWQNYKTHPMKEDPKAMFVYTLGDDEGKPAMPPKAKKVLSDTRLEPNTEKSLSYQIPASGIKVVRAELLYNLLLPKLVTQLDKVLTDDLRNPKQAAFAEVRF